MALRTPLRILYANVVDPNATMSESVAVSGFPADYCANDFIGVRSRISDRTTGYFQATFTSAQSVNCMVIQGHNLTASGTVALKGSNNNWSSSTVIVSDIDIDGADPRAFYFGTVSYTSFRLYPVDSSNPDGYIELGRWFLGTYVTLSRNYSYGWSRDRVGTSQVFTTPNQIDHLNARPMRRQITIPLDRVPVADRDLIDGVVTEQGDWSPFYVVTDLDNYPNRCDRVRFASLPQMPNVIHNRYSFVITMVEAL